MAHDHNLTSTELATELTVAWITSNKPGLTQSDVIGFLEGMQGSLMSLLTASQNPLEAPLATPAKQKYVSAEMIASTLLSKDHIISLIDGKPYKMLKRHLALHGMTPEQYRSHFGLPADYPVVAENHSLLRREMAAKSGLGHSSNKRGTRSRGPALK